MTTKQEVIRYFDDNKGACAPATRIANYLDRPAPSVRRALVSLRREGFVKLFDEQRPYWYQSAN